MLCRTVHHLSPGVNHSESKKSLLRTAFLAQSQPKSARKTGLQNEDKFGPLVPFVTVENDDKAVKLVNSTVVSVVRFTKGLRRGFAISKGIEAGYVCNWQYCSKCNCAEVFIQKVLRLVYTGKQSIEWGAIFHSADAQIPTKYPCHLHYLRTSFTRPNTFFALPIEF